MKWRHILGLKKPYNQIKSKHIWQNNRILLPTICESNSIAQEKHPS